VVLSWVLLHHMHWHCNVVPIDGSLAHTTWTSLWLLVALAYGRGWGGPHASKLVHAPWSGAPWAGTWPAGSWGASPCKAFPMAVSAGGWKAQGAGFWKAHSAGLALKLHTKHGFCEASFATWKYESTVCYKLQATPCHKQKTMLNTLRLGSIDFPASMASSLWMACRPMEWGMWWLFLPLHKWEGKGWKKVLSAAAGSRIPNILWVSEETPSSLFH